MTGAYVRISMSAVEFAATIAVAVAVGFVVGVLLLAWQTRNRE